MDFSRTGPMEISTGKGLDVERLAERALVEPQAIGQGLVNDGHAVGGAN
jgi:hypothetical protein